MKAKHVRLARVEAFKHDVYQWAAKLRVRPRQVSVQPMSRKWGSCSRQRTVCFATALLSRPDDFRRFVIVHELLHLRVRNHSRLFRSYLSAHVPGWRQFELRRSRQATK
jgi:predicted metal-dependent hydrolase